MTAAARLLALLAGLVIALLAAPARAAEGTELVVVLDTSYSMNSSYRAWGQQVPPSDPDRQAILAALIVAGLVDGTDDALTVVPLHGRPIPGSDPEPLRRLGYGSRTPFRAALSRAREILVASPRTDRMLVFLTDGMPTDYRQPAVGRELLGLDADLALFDTVILGLLPAQMPDDALGDATATLQALATRPEAYVRVDGAEDLVGHFTTAWARTLGSKARIGTLQPEASTTVRVGRYVTEVMVIAAGARPTGPFRARLTTGEGRRAPKLQGDNGCPGCTPPHTHYAVWRLPHDPDTEDEVTLTLEQGRGPVTYGIILRYDLEAVADEAVGPPGAEAPVEAWLSWRGERFDDEGFFGEDGFEAFVRTADGPVPLVHRGGGRFTAAVPTPATHGERQAHEVVFRNAWMEASTRVVVAAEAPPQLDLRLEPAAIDFGVVEVGRGTETRCAPVRIVGDTPAEDLLLAPTDLAALPEPAAREGVAVEIRRADDTPDDPRAYAICLTVPGCCGDVAATETTLTFALTDPDRARQDDVVLPVRFAVDGPSWWTCWWPWLLGLLILALLVFVIVGVLRGKDFDPDATVRVAGSKRKLPRATAVVLREQPGGRRGFYRSARVCLTASGEFVRSPSRAAVHLEATGHGEARFHLRAPLEREDRRTRQFVRVTEDEALDGPTPGVVYRCGDLYLRFG